ncbi:calreticulin-like isoform X2 [Rhincodon typus]|uniref:calreticulin-like isoform X2 n=1 Tax=Rhincodon typus TaxID=259920 RepID=UPI00202DD50F|nr:calreticulin-like isoform X2 [Rhincodon typus]
MKVATLLLAALAAQSLAEPMIYLKEEFADGDAWENRWIESKHRSDYGKFILHAGKFYGDSEKDKGIQTSQDAKFYARSIKFEEFNNEGQTLVIQYTVKHEQNIDCGGGYIKLFPANLNQEDMSGNSPYYVMFGPDICGPEMKKVHVIFSYKGKNHLIKKDIRCKDDEYTHLYTLIVHSNNTYEVKIDNEKVEFGTLEDDWDLLPPKTIKDPNAKKPEDWDDREKINDPDDVKPKNWDNPETIPDPNAKKPTDWDDEMDGEWEPPMIQNPEYKVKSGTIFDNFLITNDAKYAEEYGNQTWGITKVAEKEMRQHQEKEMKAQKEEKAEMEEEEKEGKNGGMEMDTHKYEL